ncbi:MAG: hypothetical protein JO266_06445 [Acidobacteria bacterium]|nr:hypothetical protein [Acidobacteriota bacterium]
MAVGARFGGGERTPPLLPSQYVNVGGLLSCRPVFQDLYRRAAGLIVKILKGAKPADLPVEQPAKFELIVNLKTANALGLTIPLSTLTLTEEVIE